MKISTDFYYKTSSNQMTSQQSKVSTLQAKLGTGTQILNPSDDTGKSVVISRLESARAKQATYLQNVETAQTRLTLEEASMESMTKVMQRITELNIRAASDTASLMDRQIIANEVSALRDELLKMLNTQDINGDYIFSGAKVRTPAFTLGPTGDVEYTGDQSLVNVNVSEVRTIQINTLGSDLFNSTDFAELDSLITNLELGNGAEIRKSLGAVNTITDKLTIAFGNMAGRATAVESQRQAIEDVDLRLQQVLSSEKDLDYASAVTELTKETVALQALQASFSKVAQLSLFNYIR